ncbi:MAG: metal ABC transporter ATP-binding protein [Planctomycetota bacterium]|nr:metal ABC transporter ATP-binding protein [Planctomycetota bacterium]
MKSEALITFEKVGVTIGGARILEDVSAVIRRGETTAVIGPNGAGKTTLLLAVLGLARHTGTIRFAGGRRPRMGYVPQRLVFDRGAPVTAMDFLASAIQRWPLWLGVRREARRRASEALEQVGAGHLVRAPMGRLSGGEHQRVLLALALVGRPELLLLDEPAAGVDIAGEQIFCDLLDGLKKERDLTLVLVSHDLSMVTSHADHVICLNRTVRCQGAAPEVLTPENLASLYGIHMGLYRHAGRAAEGKEPEGHSHDRNAG